MKKILIITLVALIAFSCSVKKNISKVETDTTKSENALIETEIVETITVKNDTAVMTEPETIETKKEIDHARPDSVFTISIESDKVSAEVTIDGDEVTLTATAKAQEVKVEQTTTIERKTTVKEQKETVEHTETKTKDKVVEKEPFKIPFWVWLLFVAVVLVLLFVEYRSKIIEFIN